MAKVTFDGPGRRILINTGVSTINIKDDVYSPWKHWVEISDNAKYLPALRTIGGDPVGGGIYAGDMYFLMNGWRIVVDDIVYANGILYNDDAAPPFVVLPGGGITSTVSSLAYSVSTAGVPAPTVEEIRQELDVNSAKLQSIDNKVQSLPTVQQIWEQPISTMTDKTTIGGYISKMILTIPKFLGLK